MNIKFRLTLMSFLQFFVWGAWLITIATYFFSNNMGTSAQFGAIFGTLALSSLFMPAITGIIADKFMDAEKLYGILHILYGGLLFIVPQADNAGSLYWVIFGAMICYMPTISLSNSIAYTILKREGCDVVKVFPPIRVWGTIGFIVAMWTTNLTGSKANGNQFIIGGIAAILLGLFSFTLPKCPPQKTIAKGAGIVEQLGLQAFTLFKQYKMALFFLFSMLLGGALQLTNAYGDTFLDDFKKVPTFGPDAFVVKYSTIILSISQMSETLFILTIPFFLKRFGIKNVMLFSMLAWVIRFGLFAYGDPGANLWMIIVSCIVYGMAFDFFNISGSLFVETTTPAVIRSSAQGLFMMMTNGLGAFLGSRISGWVIDRFYTLRFTTLNNLLGYLKTDASNPAVQEITKFNPVQNGIFKETVLIKEWHPIWLAFAGYSLVVAVLFFLLFRHKHDPITMDQTAD
jgi:MFS transporter, NHS family, xanthosine permease